MKDVLGLLRDANNYLACYKSKLATKEHAAYYFIDQAIKIIEGGEKKYVFPNEVNYGLSLRDFFAGQNMPELLKMSWETYKDCLGSKAEEENFATEDVWIRIAAELSYKAANAMLTEREKV
jgi:hypothetical protein